MARGVDDGEMAGQERVGQQGGAGGDGQQCRPHRFGDEQVGDAFDVGCDPPAFGYDAGQGGESVVEQHQFGDRLGRGRARAHGDADVGEFEREHVVDPVAGHGHRVPARLQRLDHGLFLVRCHPAEDEVFLEQRAERAGVFGQVPRVDGVAGVGHARARRDGADGARAVAGDHLERHALGGEVGDGRAQHPGAVPGEAGGAPLTR
jgi:hypothetical protein